MIKIYNKNPFLLKISFDGTKEAANTLFLTQLKGDSFNVSEFVTENGWYTTYFNFAVGNPFHAKTKKEIFMSIQAILSELDYDFMICQDYNYFPSQQGL